MLLVEENHVLMKRNTLEGQMLYTHLDGGRGRDQARRGRFGQGRGGHSKEEGSFHADRNRQNNTIKCG